ncbi:hypothetical protein LY76DRAFT_242866 [Colletotrichum caudatum]|nr:hypothetical protein LY76DRAFT_242866 [Colletotrichum caudatum]
MEVGIKFSLMYRQCLSLRRMDGITKSERIPSVVKWLFLPPSVVPPRGSREASAGWLVGWLTLTLVVALHLLAAAHPLAARQVGTYLFSRVTHAEECAAHFNTCRSGTGTSHYYVCDNFLEVTPSRRHTNGRYDSTPSGRCAAPPPPSSPP